MHHHIKSCLYLLALLLALPLSAQAVVDKVLYADQANVSFSKLDYSIETTVSPYQGRHALLMQPDVWHNPFMRLAPGRVDFRPYDVLEFFIRSPSAVIRPKFMVWDYANSNTIDVATYTQGGVVDASWRKVSIPIKSMINSQYALDSVYIMQFSKMATPYPFYIDQIVLRSTSTPKLTGSESRSNRSISLTFESFSIPLTQAGRYTIQSPDDAQYQQAVAALKVGIDRQAIGTVDTGIRGLNSNASINESRLHLLLPFPMQAGKHYQVNYHDVRRDNGLFPVSAIHTIVYQAGVNGSVQVNQVGYMPNAKKRAFVGNWLGSAGAMPIDYRIFHVVDAATKLSVYQGSLTARALQDVWSGNDVYIADFSAFTQTGRYYIDVPGVGRSYNFSIKPNVFESVYRTTMRTLYHKRNSALLAPYVDKGRERSGGIPASLDGVFHPALAASPLYNGEQAQQYKAIAPGWFDAGDLGEYISNQAPIWSAISTALDLASPNSFQDGELNIPESGNGIPDIIDELSWGSRWALSMQDKRDGGVYWRICSGNWDYVPPSQVSKPRYIYEKTTVATAQFSAMMAIYARLIAPYDATAAAKAKAASLQAWNYLKTHPTWPAEGKVYHNPTMLAGAVGCGEYPTASSKPAQLWAAAELYRLTGKAQYQADYERLFHSIKNPQVANYNPSEVGDASWALMMSKHPNRDPYLTQLARTIVMRGADSILAKMNTHPFYSSTHAYLGFTGWHSFSGSAIAAIKLFQGYHITHDLRYRDAAWITSDIELGANPQNRSYLTGIGYNPPLHPLDTSFFDPSSQIIRGRLVPGITHHLPSFRQPYIAVNKAYYPKEQTQNPTPWISNAWGSIYPILRRYTDSSDLIPMSESTVKEGTWNAVAFALLRDENLPTQLSPTAYTNWKASQAYAPIVFQDIPLADVPLLKLSRIRAFGSSMVHAPPAWLQALSPEQVGHIQAPQRANWVAVLSSIQKRGLTAKQIAGFIHESLFLALLPEQVPLIPAAKIATFKTSLVNQSKAWMQQLSLAQMRAIQAAPGGTAWKQYLSATQIGLLEGRLIDKQAPVVSMQPKKLIMSSQASTQISSQDPRIQAWLKQTTVTDNLGTIGVIRYDLPPNIRVGQPLIVTASISDIAGNTGTGTGILSIKPLASTGFASSTSPSPSNSAGGCAMAVAKQDFDPTLWSLLLMSFLWRAKNKPSALA